MYTGFSEDKIRDLKRIVKNVSGEFSFSERMEA